MPPISLEEPSGRYVSFAELEEIALLRARECGVREIARHLGRAPSTVSRELRRTTATRGGRLDYRASVAQWHDPPSQAVQTRRARRAAAVCAGPAVRNGHRPGRPAVTGPEASWKGRNKPRRQDRRRWGTVWSPEQIARRLLIDLPEDETMRISHEAIYQALYILGRGGLQRELTACLRTGRALRVPRARSKGRGKNFVTEDVLISQRPAEAEDRAVPGHWEGDRATRSCTNLSGLTDWRSG